MVRAFRRSGLSIWRLALLMGTVTMFGIARVPAQTPAATATPAPQDWDAAPQTLVLFNSSSESSRSLAEYYAKLRKIPPTQVVGFPMPAEETISREAFETKLREPLLRKLIDNKWWVMEKRDLLDPNGKSYGQVPQVVKQDIQVLVIMKGVPLRVAKTGESSKPGEMDEASVDSEFAAIGMLNRPQKGAIENRYYESALRFPDTQKSRGQLIVGRLDAADDATVRRMIDDTMLAEKDGLWGRAVVDFSLMDGPYAQGEQWLGRSVALYRELGIPVYVDRTKDLIADAWPLPDTILYFGWYTDKIRGAFASPDFRFKRGAIACHLHSFSAATLRDKNAAWCAPLLDHGAAATLGNVWEPYLMLTPHFDILNARLLRGFTFGEAAWAATPGISWMNVVIGDPLYTPFPKKRDAISGDPADLDYALYYDLVERYLAHDPKKLRRELIRIAEQKESPRLLEFAALISTMDEKYGEASDFYQHAAALYTDTADQLRCAIYEAELGRRGGDPKAGLASLARIFGDQKFAGVPGLAAVAGLQKLLQAK